MHQFMKFGYYSKPFKFNHKGKVIALNTNACYDLNWYLVSERYDPGNQLEWLEEQLRMLEEEEGFAYIIGHVPPYHCLHNYGIRYKALMERFQHVVRFSSFGHTHDESFFVDLEFNKTSSAAENKKAVSWGMVHGSVTTFEGRNPSFTVVHWDKNTMVPVNVETYFLNITKANALKDGEEPKWELHHDFINEYELKDLSPSSMQDLSERLYKDTKGDLIAKYERNWNRGGKDNTGKNHTPVKNDIFYKCL
jgi:sphingomyelin phosphodiesterase acid-like 3